VTERQRTPLMKLLVDWLNGTFAKNNKMSRVIGTVNYLCISTSIHLNLAVPE